MSLVAGCNLIDCVLLAADCRVTYRFPQQDTHADVLQKLFPINTGTAIAFVDDVYVAGVLLRKMFQTLPKLARHDPITLSRWLPRFFRHEFQKLKRYYAGNVTFIVASVIQNRPNLIQRKLLIDIIMSEVSRTNTIPPFALDLFRAKTELVSFAAAPTTLLYSMSSPTFDPIPYEPLHYIVEGSGNGCSDTIKERMGFAVVQNSMNGMSYLCHTIQRYLKDSGVDSIGGLLTMFRLDSQGVRFFGIQTKNPISETEFQISYRNGRITQRNSDYTEDVPLLFPWEMGKKLRTSKYDLSRLF